MLNVTPVGRKQIFSMQNLMDGAQDHNRKARSIMRRDAQNWHGLRGIGEQVRTHESQLL